MVLPQTGFDSNSTYFEHNLNSKEIPNIFIHGVGLDNKMWLPQKKYFRNKQVLFYDLLNHGNSKKGYSELNFNNFSDQLNLLLQYLNIDKFNLIGFSIGALISQYFANKYYDRINKLIIIASIYKRTHEQITNVRNRYNRALKGESINDDSINRWFNKEYLKNNPDVYEFFFNILKNKKNEDFIPAYKVFIESENHLLNFSNFKMPTLIMTGEYDIGSTPYMSKMLHKEIRDSKLCIIPGAKHMATFEKASLINSKISNFVNQN